MLAYLRGHYAGVDEGSVLLDVGGVGYRLWVTAATLGELPDLGAELTLQTFLQVRDDAFVLYGFVTRAERGLFEELITVNGIGPKLALAILSVLGGESLRRAVATEDVAALSRVPGVGKKTAQRLALELRDRLGVEGEAGTAALVAAAPPDDPFRQAVEALIGLGYSGQEAGRAIDRVRGELDATADVEDLVRHGLRSLGGAR